MNNDQATVYARVPDPDCDQRSDRDRVDMTKPIDLQENQDMLFTSRLGHVFVWCSCELLIHVYTPSTQLHRTYEGEEWEPWGQDQLEAFAIAYGEGKTTVKQHKYGGE